MSNIALNSVSSIVPTDPMLDPRSIRWGYGAGCYNPSVDARLSGMQSGSVPQNVLVPFETFNYPDDNPSMEPGQSRLLSREQTAFDAIEYVKQQFRIFGLYDKGFREIEFLRGRRDFAVLDQLFSAVHPDFTQIGHECPSGIEQCVSCRLELLESNQDFARISREAGRGLVSPAEVEGLHRAVLEANQALYDHYSETWREVLSEYDEGRAGRVGLRTLGEGHRHIMRNLHEIEPEHRNAQAAAAFGEAQSHGLLQGLEKQGQMFADALKTIGGNNNNDQLAAVLLQMQQSQAQNQELMLKILERQSGKETEPAETSKQKGK